jgi:Fe-S-cluster containining protein
MPAPVFRFACTQCGKCCNRSPEVELGEAAPLADVFVFRLLFRLHRLPRGLADYRGRHPHDSAEVFFETKRLLDRYAVRKRAMRDESEYLIVSTLTLDTGAGACSALAGGLCSIYERRPFACRTVPLHYTGVEAAAARDLAVFVATPGYACDTGGGAPVVLEGGRIVEPATIQARADAFAAAERDRPWKQAILRRMRPGAMGEWPLPTLAQVEAHAAHGAVSTSMRAAWQVAVEAGLMPEQECQALIEAQLARIERELALGRGTADARQTLGEMRAEYRHSLGR